MIHYRRNELTELHLCEYEGVIVLFDVNGVGAVAYSPASEIGVESGIISRMV